MAGAQWVRREDGGPLGYEIDGRRQPGTGMLLEDRATGRPVGHEHPHAYGQVPPPRQPPAPSSRRPRRRRRRRVLLAVLAVAVAVAAVPAWTAFNVWNDWRAMDRESLDSAAFGALPPVEAPSDGSTSAGYLPPAAPVAAPAAGEISYQTFLIVGLDASELRSDVIVMMMLPDDGSSPVMVSLPRDLYVPNRCTQSYTRINANFNGCGDINGATALSGAVTDFTGYDVDHFALFTFDGFARIIDHMGGMEICNDNPTREIGRFEFPAGCTQVDGETTLQWVRSRKTEELVDGRWQRMPDVSDLTRNERQQDMILTVLKQASEFQSPQEMASMVTPVADAFTLDDGLGMSAALDLAWSNRGLDPESIVRPTIPVTDHVTEQGAQVLIPTMSFQDVLDQALAG